MAGLSLSLIHIFLIIIVKILRFQKVVRDINFPGGIRPGNGIDSVDLFYSVFVDFGLVDRNIPNQYPGGTGIAELDVYKRQVHPGRKRNPPDWL